MAPSLDIGGKDYERARKILELSGIEYSILEEEKLRTSEKYGSNFIYVPDMKLYIAKERTLQNSNWYEAHKELQENKERMLTSPEFIKFLNYLKNSNNLEYLEIFEDITKVKSPWRAEWIDAKFDSKGGKLRISYHHKLDENKCLIPQNSELLIGGTLIKDKTPGISLDDMLENPTNQGLPSKKTKSGDTHYWNPRDGSVATFCVGPGWSVLDCCRGPSGSVPSLGVRAVKRKIQ